MKSSFILDMDVKNTVELIGDQTVGRLCISQSLLILVMPNYTFLKLLIKLNACAWRVRN